MNKFKKTLLAIIGGCDVSFYIVTPIIIGILWVKVIGLEDWTSYFFYTIGLLSTIFRSIKIGWFKGDKE